MMSVVIPIVPMSATTHSQSSQLMLLMVFRMLFVYALAKNLNARIMAATHSSMIDAASKAGPRLAVEFASLIAPQPVPGVFAPNAVATGLAAGETAPVGCDVAGAAARLDEEMVSEDREALEATVVAGAADAEARTLGQNVLLKACTSEVTFASVRSAVEGSR